MDYPFQEPEDLSIIQNWCKINCANLKSILVVCSNETLWAERFNKRAVNPAPNQLILKFDDLKKHYHTLQLVPEPGEVVIDSVLPLPVLVEMLDKVLTGD